VSGPSTSPFAGLSDAAWQKAAHRWATDPKACVTKQGRNFWIDPDLGIWPPFISRPSAVKALRRAMLAEGGRRARLAPPAPAPESLPLEACRRAG
jgi:hypothetical protein